MSTKIWSARRLKRGVALWPYVASVRARAEKRVQKTLAKFYLDTVATVEQSTGEQRAEWLKRLDVGEEKDKYVSPYTISRWVSKEFRHQNTRAEIDFFGMDVSIAFREHRGRIYLIPYANGMMRKVLDFLRTDPQSEDFHWQNQTDKSAPCSNLAWEQRGRTWKAMMDPDDRWWNMLVLDILSPGNFYRIDPSIRMAKKWLAQREKKA